MPFLNFTFVFFPPYRLFGDLQAKELVNNMKLTEFRAFFENIQSMNANELTSMFQEFPKMKTCYDHFVETQGRLVSKLYIFFFFSFI